MPRDTKEQLLLSRRLRAQRLSSGALESPVEVVRWMGAMQSQDYAGAKWALGQRSRGTTEAQIDRLFDRGEILRTHVMRPTWHFVLPDDVRWLLELTAPRIRRGLAARYRELELDDKVVARAGTAFAAALEGGRHLTRPELGAVLRKARISPEGQRLPHLIMSAELDRLIVSGPRRGRQFTYALLKERTPNARPMDRTEALLALTQRYFRSHGPALIQDFGWWSGLALADVRAGIALASGTLEHQAIDGRDYWFDPNDRPVPDAAGSAHLLPSFDEYTVGYRDRAALLHAERPFNPELFSFGSILANVVTIAGVVRGAWHRAPARAGVTVEIRAMGPFQAAERASVEAACRRFGRFLERPVQLSWL